MKTAFRRDEVEVVNKERVYDGYFKVDRYEFVHPLYAGGQSEILSREVFERGQVGAVLPYDPVTDQIVLIEQFRPGPYAAGSECWLLETVAGVLESGENPEQLVIREAEEEAGCKIQALEYVMRFFVSPGASTETVDLFCGKVNTIGIGGLHGLASEGEDIKVMVVDREEAWSMLGEGKFVNAKTIIALQWLQLNWQRMQKLWNEP
ncbi:MAG: ADP-ribose pyrophosphatase [Parasphingorhabdus sp.]|jgi:ADP-ribose pyrophosphatase